MLSPLSPLSLYLHIPFCTHRCAYCDFNTYAGQEAVIPAYVEAVGKEIEFTGKRLPSSYKDGGEVHTVFFGGGTPSLLSPNQFESILETLRRNFRLTDEAEITIEANPGTVSLQNLLALRRIGINRISYGVQSSSPEELRMLERAHDFFDVIEAVTSARKAGFDNLNLDLIYGLPEQTLPSWQKSVRRILDLRPEHISAYALTLEHGTPFGRWASKGLLPQPDPDLAADMYEWLSETLEANGYIQYEISNWAKHLASSGGQRGQDSTSYPSLACRHNLQYWRGLPYLAFGAGAHGYAGGYRYSNVLRIKTYIDRMGNYPLPQSLISTLTFPLSPASVNHHRQSLADDMSEFMMTGLRLTREGIRGEEFLRKFGQSLRNVYGKEIEDLLQAGLIETLAPPGKPGSVPLEGVGGEGVRLTPRGRLLGNQVFMRFLKEADREPGRPANVTSN